MKVHTQKVLALSVMSVLALSACGGGDGATIPPIGGGNGNGDTPTLPAPIVVTPPSTPAPLPFVVTLGVTDAATDSLITNKAVKIQFKENDANTTNLVSVTGAAFKDADLTLNDGQLSFRIKSGATPQNVSVVISAEGYLTKSYVLDLSNTTESFTTVFPLVSATSAGVVAKTETAAVASGTVAAPVTANASEGSTSAGVAIPAGTVLQNAQGQAVSGTSVNLTIATAAKTGSGAKLADIIPQGLNAETGSQVLVPLAGASVQMADNLGNKIKKFSSPISLSLNIPAAANVAAGDNVSISSYDEDTGVWTRNEFTATVGALNTATNSHTVTFETDHLTFFGAGRSETVCPTAITYSVTSGSVPTGGLALTIESSDAIAIGSLKANVTSGIFFSAASVARFGIYNGAAGRIKVTSPSDRSVVYYDSVTEVPVCGTLALPLTPPSTTLVAEDFNVNLVCSNDTTVTKGLSGALVTYGLPGKVKVQATDNNNGRYSLANLVQGSTYEVKVQPVGVSGVNTTNFTVTADGTAETRIMNISCPATTGTGAS